MSTPPERSSNGGLVAKTPVSASEPNLNLDLTHVSQFVKIKCNCRTAKLPARQISSYIAVFQNRFLLYLPLLLVAESFSCAYINWENYNYRIDGDFEFIGVDFNLEENLGHEFNNLVDSIFDEFSSTQFTTTKYRFNPYVINFGAVYNLQNLNDNLNFDFELQKLKTGFLVTYSLQYYKYFPAQKIVISPTYRLNKFSYTNLSLLIYKRWHNNFLSSIYFGNLLMITELTLVSNIGSLC